MASSGGNRRIPQIKQNKRPSDKLEENIKNGEKLVRAAAAQGAQVVLLQELFAGPYFCQVRRGGQLRWRSDSMCDVAGVVRSVN